MRHAILRSRAGAVAIAFAAMFLSQCKEADLIAPVDQQIAKPVPMNATLLICTASVSTRSVSCVPGDQTAGQSLEKQLASAKDLVAASSPLSPGVIVGGQNLFVTLTGSNVTTTGGIYAFDVTVKNLIGQALGTTDGTTVAPEGVRVFFGQQPVVTGGTGTISIANADGTDAFTTSDQPYYQYSEMIAPGATSSVKRWQFAFTGNPTFSFGVYVYGPVQYPNGWVKITPASSTLDLNGTKTVQLNGQVVDALGRAVSSPPAISWGTSNSSVATVDGTGLVTAVAIGSATITATADSYTGTAAITVINTVDATTQTWNVAAAGDWSTAANWTPAYVPAANDTAEIAISGGAPALSVDASIGFVHVGSSATLDIGTHTLTVATGVNGEGSITSGATGLLLLNGTTLGGVLPNMQIAGDATLSSNSTVQGKLVIGGGRLIITDKTLLISN